MKVYSGPDSLNCDRVVILWDGKILLLKIFKKSKMENTCSASSNDFHHRECAIQPIQLGLTSKIVKCAICSDKK